MMEETLCYDIRINYLALKMVGSAKVYVESLGSNVSEI